MGRQLATMTLLLCMIQSSASFSMIRRHIARPIAALSPSSFRYYHQTIRFKSTTEAVHEVNYSYRNDDQASRVTIDIKKNNGFQVTAPFQPMGDQPEAIAQLLHQLQNKDRFSILQGITGTGKTLVMAHVIANWGKPTLVLCHNKTLAAQLARELRSFLSKNAIELFVSYYNHYIPESFKETTGTYIAKKSSVNKEIDALRHRATRSLLTRKDVVVVSSVSCIYGLGMPKEYLDASVEISVGDNNWSPKDLMDKLDIMLYQVEASQDEFNRGNYYYAFNGQNNNTFTLTLWPPHELFPMRIDLEKETSDDDAKTWTVKSIHAGQKDGSYNVPSACIFPAKHHITSEDQLERACIAIEEEMRQQVREFMACGKMVEASRLQKRVSNDLLLLRETGFCPGGENYSRHFAGRQEGEPPDTLINYMSNHGDWLLIADESHVTVPQLKAMYNGDRARKQRLVQHGFRLPSALDNRPLREEEFWDQVQQGIFVSATPSKQDVKLSNSKPVDMIIRPTFVCDPVVEVRSSKGQLEDLLHEIQLRTKKQERTLVVALTKRDAEDLACWLNDNGVNSTYMHSGCTTNERCESLKALQNGQVDCLVGVNLLREGLDLPQVSLVAILNADSEGFLRSETALFQMVGRAARNIHGMAILYASRITDSMQKCIDTTKLRRERQIAYNAEFGHEMKSTQGSSTLSIFDILKEQIQMEQQLLLESSGSSSTSQQSQPNNAAREEEEEQFSPDVTVAVPSSPSLSSPSQEVVATHHVPSSPGVYFWKDTSTGTILYIGKAKKLRSRVNSYLSPNAKHSARIKAMLKKADKVDIILTESERDALMLESNAIKHYQPPYNVLLKDDESYPYICASLGDALPRFFMAPRRQRGGGRSSNYRYYGPYTNMKEINIVLEEIEARYELRKKMFMVRLGNGSKEDYNKLFLRALDEVFGSSNCNSNNDSNFAQTLAARRAEFEEASLLFENKRNQCRDIVAIAKVPVDKEESPLAVVHVVQLREGLVFGRFSYTCQLPKWSGTTAEAEEEEYFTMAIQTVLEQQHYPAGEESRNGRFSFFPNEILFQYMPDDTANLRRIIQKTQKQIEPDRTSRVKLRTVSASATSSQKGPDQKALEFAITNAKQAAFEKSLTSKRATKTSVDGTAVSELVGLLNLEKHPVRIECYDISHTQGQFPVGSRVVFLDGTPAPHLYRKFNIQASSGNDDYASLEEVFQRRFRRAWVNGQGGPVPDSDPWSLPDLVVVDGGPGQLNAALKGMAKAGIFPKNKNDDGSGGDNDGTLAAITSGPGRRASVNVCALAKNQEELFVQGLNEPINDEADSPALLLLRSLRDESHRFALQSHRKRRSILKSN